MQKVRNRKQPLNTKVKVCPYCNRQYITSYESKDGTEKTTADVDHYYPQSAYPYLQMNIYNMIPSCNICNSKAKGPKDERHLNPYKASSDSLLFEVLLDNIDMMYSSEIERIAVNSRGNPKAIASNEVFKLDKIYQVHLEDVKSLFFHIKEYEAFKEDYYTKTMGFDIGNIFSLWFDFLNGRKTHGRYICRNVFFNFVINFVKKVICINYLWQ